MLLQKILPIIMLLQNILPIFSHLKITDTLNLSKYKTAFLNLFSNKIKTILKIFIS
jgi:hypothetical protein